MYISTYTAHFDPLRLDFIMYFFVLALFFYATYVVNDIRG